MGGHEYVWDALGRLSQIRQESKPLVSYSYNRWGERIGKSLGSTNSSTASQTISYPYDNGQRAVELNEQGQITRQYIYLADLPIAVIDTPEGKALSKQELSVPVMPALDAQTILKHWFAVLTGSAEQLGCLSTNHLGAAEATTDGQSQVIWQASCAAFAAAQVVKTNWNDKSAGKASKQLCLEPGPVQPAP